jgi:hypothetical protein
MTTKCENQLLAALESVALPIAHATERVPTTAATPEQIDLVYALRLLAGTIPPLLPKVITGELESNHWAHLADILYQAARLCREQVVIDGDTC